MSDMTGIINFSIIVVLSVMVIIIYAQYNIVNAKYNRLRMDVRAESLKLKKLMIEVDAAMKALRGVQ